MECLKEKILDLYTFRNSDSVSLGQILEAAFRRQISKRPPIVHHTLSNDFVKTYRYFLRPDPSTLYFRINDTSETNESSVVSGMQA